MVATCNCHMDLSVVAHPMRRMQIYRVREKSAQENIWTSM